MEVGGVGQFGATVDEEVEAFLYRRGVTVEGSVPATCKAVLILMGVDGPAERTSLQVRGGELSAALVESWLDGHGSLLVIGVPRRIHIPQDYRFAKIVPF